MVTPRRRKKQDVLRGLIQTVRTGGKEADRVLVDAGSETSGTYRLTADLKRKTCPRCGDLHFTAMETDLCVECFVIDAAEEQVGRPLTQGRAATGAA